MKKQLSNTFISTLNNKESNLQVINVLNSYFGAEKENKINFFINYNVSKIEGTIMANNITKEEIKESTALCFGFYYGKNFPRLAFHNKE